MNALDRLLPRADVTECHHRDVAGPPERTYAAIHAFTLGEMPLARLLFALRGLTARRGGLVRAAQLPLIEQMVAGGFTLLVDEPGRELVAGAIAQPWRLRGAHSVPVDGAEAFTAFEGPGFVKMAMGFHVERRGSGTGWRPRPVCSRPTPAAVAASAVLDSGAHRQRLIRRAMLRAIARRVEAETAASGA